MKKKAFVLGFLALIIILSAIVVIKSSHPIQTTPTQAETKPPTLQTSNKDSFAVNEIKYIKMINDFRTVRLRFFEFRRWMGH